MKEMKKVLISCLILIALSFTGCSKQADSAAAAGANETKVEDPKFISLAGGSVGGGWYVLCGVIAEMLTPVFPGSNVKVTTGGSVSNPTSVSLGKVEIAATQDNIYADALSGSGPYVEDGKVANISGLARLGEIYMSVFLVEENSKYESIDQIIENEMPIRLVTAVQGSSPALATDRVLETYGISAAKIKEWGGSVTYVSYSEATSLMKDGHADAYCGPIMPATIELAVTKDLRPLPLSQNTISSLCDTYKYGRSTIPAGTYDFIKEDLDVITENPILVIKSDMPDEVVYKITKTICESPEKIQGSSNTYKTWTPELASQISGGPIHPGALKYYQEMGWVK